VRLIAGATLLVSGGAAYGASCTFGSSNETTLQGVFDSVLGSGAPSATNDCLSAAQDAVWNPPGETAATIIIELAGFAANNVFGIYDPQDPLAKQVTVFTGGASIGDSATIQLVANGSGFDVRINNTPQSMFASNEFGFFLQTPQQHTFFSQAQLNSDSADHMYAYQGAGQLFVAGPLAGLAFATSMYLLAFEDLLIPQGDEDYQDFVVAVNFVPIPLPAGIWLLGSALAWFAALSRRRRVNNSA
jgi:hypothetical protein